MTCDEANILLHALIDGELDAGHARDVEAHIATCPSCAAELAAYRQMREAMAKTDLRFTAPESLRRRIDAVLLPRRIVMLDALPRDPTGKLPAGRLAALAVEHLGREPAAGDS